VGKTAYPLPVRLSQHLYDARCGKKRYLYNWIRSILSSGHIPIILLIGEAEGDGVKEEIAWIDYGRKEGWRLVNTTNGGEGILGYKHTKETRIKMSIAKKGIRFSQEHCQKMSEIRKGKPNGRLGCHESWEHRQKISKALKGRSTSEETRKKLSESNMGKHHSEETRKKMSLSKKMYYQNLLNNQNNEAQI
jgi:hypothetical protein